jgi:hypothetical protein
MVSDSGGGGSIYKIAGKEGGGAFPTCPPWRLLPGEGARPSVRWPRGMRARGGP